MRCWGGVVAAASAASLLPYLPKASFQPADYPFLAESKVWPADGSMAMETGYGYYNPSVAALPPAVRERAQRFVGNNNRRAAYISSFKRSSQYANCDLLLDPGYVRSRPKFKGFRNQMAAFALLDENMQLVGAVTIEASDELMVTMKHNSDTRLDVRDERILVHSSLFCRFCKNRRTYTFFWLNLDANASHVVGRPERIAHPDIDGDATLIEGQNYGILWNGRNSSPFSILWWLGQPLDVRDGIPARPRNHDSLPLVNGLRGPYSHTLHNTGTPLNLAPWGCSDLWLALGHTAATGATDVPGWRYSLQPTQNQTKFGNTYLYNFVLHVGEKSDYKVLVQSRLFCFPSSASPHHCDIIQFVGSFIQSLANPSNILFAYGVNDCESAWIELPVKDLLAFVLDRPLLAPGSEAFPTSPVGRCARYHDVPFTQQ